jgi:hypothetical protein
VLRSGLLSQPGPGRVVTPSGIEHRIAPRGTGSEGPPSQYKLHKLRGHAEKGHNQALVIWDVLEG